MEIREKKTWANWLFRLPSVYLSVNTRCCDSDNPKLQALKVVFGLIRDLDRLGAGPEVLQRLGTALELQHLKEAEIESMRQVLNSPGHGLMGSDEQARLLARIDRLKRELQGL